MICISMYVKYVNWDYFKYNFKYRYVNRDYFKYSIK